MSDSRVSFVEEVDIAGRSGLGSGQMMRMVTSADYLHVHPLRMQPRDGTEANGLFFLCPSSRHTPDWVNEPKRELCGGWWFGESYPLNGSDRCEPGLPESPPAK